MATANAAAAAARLQQPQGPSARRASSRRAASRVVTAAAGGDRRVAIPEPRPLSAVEDALSKLATPAAYALGGGLVAVGAGAGAALGGVVAPQSTPARAAVAVVAGVAAAAGAAKLLSLRSSVAAKELFNSLAGDASPGELLPEKIAALERRFGVASLAASFAPELCEIYDCYLTSVLPVGDAQLEGWEVAAVRDFKAALGLSDQDAAGVHMEVGRRIFRSRMEQGDKSAEASARREFQKLVYVSNLAFGSAKAAFLLPWKRVFQVTDSQVAVAVRDSALKLFRDRLAALLPDAAAERAPLEALEEYRLECGLEAEAAAEVLTAACRARVEAAAGRALEGLRARTRARDVSGSMAELEGILAYNRALAALAASPAGLPPGLQPVCLFGGAYDADAKMGELRDLFRMFVAERIKEGSFDDASLAAAAELRVCFGMGAKEADGVVLDVSTKVYRQQLRKALQEGRLAAAASPAAQLQAMCEALRFPPPAAEGVHLELYRGRLEEAMASGSLSEADDAAVAATRRLLCVSAATDRAARKEVCGEAWKKTLVVALSAGPDAFSADLRDKVAASRAAVRLADDVALELLGDMVRKVWLNTVRESRNKASRLDAAKELRQMVLFNEAVVTPLVASIKGSKTDAAAKEIAELLKEAQAAAKAEDAAAVPASEAVIDVEAQSKADAEEVAAISAAAKPPGHQKDISLRDDLPSAQRSELYKTFLLFCMTGDQMSAPMGSTITIERDQSEFTRLAQLGDVLGLNPLELSEVHRGLAEEAFRANAQQLLGAEAAMTREKAESLKALQAQLGLSDEAAKKIVGGITSGKAAANLQARVATGKLSLEDCVSMAAEGVDVANALSADSRLALLRKEVEAALTGGSGVWDAARWLEAAPAQLALEPAKVSAEVRKLAGDKRRSQLVQAVALLRQRDTAAVQRALANLRACSAALPGEPPLAWPVKEELMDLYSVSAAGGAGAEELGGLAAALALDEATCEQLRAVVASGGFVLERESAAEALY